MSQYGLMVLSFKPGSDDASQNEFSCAITTSNRNTSSTLPHGFRVRQRAFPASLFVRLVVVMRVRSRTPPSSSFSYLSSSPISFFPVIVSSLARLTPLSASSIFDYVVEDYRLTPVHESLPLPVDSALLDNELLLHPPFVCLVAMCRVNALARTLRSDIQHGALKAPQEGATTVQGTKTP